MSSIPSAPPVRIIVADGHPIRRSGLRALIESRAGHTLVGESANGPAAIVLARDLAPDILLLCATTVERVLQTIDQVAAQERPVRTIVLAPSLRHDDVAEAIRRGARAVISTNTATDVLFRAIDVVMNGGIWIGVQPASGADQTRERRRFARRSVTPNAFGLTPREMDVLRAVVNGETNKGIAHRCAISENTVKRHLLHLFDKIGASNRVELALFAQHHELTQGV
jgi:DNA-binding NarL/FixJ family response regulator